MRYVYSLFVFAAALYSQSFQGSLRGRIVDPKAATIPLAKITIVDEGTGTARSILTSDQGEYTFAALTPSTYTVVAEAPGFKKAARTGVVVSTQTAVTVDLTLELGQVNEQVNVTAEATLIETADASTGQVIDSQKLTDLPNLGRNPFMLSKLSESVVQVGNPKFNRMQDQSGSSQISIAGGPGARQQLHARWHLDHRLHQSRRDHPVAGIRGGDEGAGQYLRRRNGPHRRRHVQHVPALRHQRDPRQRLRLSAAHRVARKQFLLQPRRPADSGSAIQELWRIDRRPRTHAQNLQRPRPHLLLRDRRSLSPVRRERYAPRGPHRRWNAAAISPRRCPAPATAPCSSCTIRRPRSPTARACSSRAT